jgi:hypothetical protein
MRNAVDIDHRHSRAICDEIGERLQSHLRIEADLPVSLRMQVEQLHRLEVQSPSIVSDLEHGVGNEPNKDGASGGGQFRFTWPWRRKT